MSTLHKISDILDIQNYMEIPGEIIANEYIHEAGLIIKNMELNLLDSVDDLRECIEVIFKENCEVDITPSKVVLDQIWNLLQSIEK